MDSRKPQCGHPINVRWLADLQHKITAAAQERLVEGVFGEIDFSLTIRDGLIQSVTESTKTVHRHSAAVSDR